VAVGGDGVAVGGRGVEVGEAVAAAMGDASAIAMACGCGLLESLQAKRSMAATSEMRMRNLGVIMWTKW
jgi:hypothetical protein